jgi:hypothetical protein
MAIKTPEVVQVPLVHLAYDYTSGGPQMTQVDSP